MKRKLGFVMFIVPIIAALGFVGFKVVVRCGVGALFLIIGGVLIAVAYTFVMSWLLSPALSDNEIEERKRKAEDTVL